MIQVNIPEHYLSLVQDPPPKTTTEECLSQLEKVLLPWPSSLAQELWYRPTRLLAAVVCLCLKHKFFNGSTAKEACTTFEVWAKQLSKCCLVKFTSVYPLEPPKANVSSLTLWPVRGMWLVMSLPLRPPHQEVNIICHQCSSTGGTKMGFFMTTPE